MPRITIRNGRLIDPARNVDTVTDLVLERGKVAHVGKLGKSHKSTGKVIDATGLIVSPGLIDPHVHLREPGQEDKETIATGTAAAVNGGFTSVCCMPNTDPAIDDDARIDFVYWQAAREGACHVYPAGAVTKARKGEELAEIGLMAEAGAVAFTDDGDAIGSAGMMARALAYVKMTGRVLMQHCEEPTLICGGAMNAGALATRLGLSGRPAVAEELIIQRDIMLNRSVGCPYHVQHLSTEGGVDLVRAARKVKLPVTGEATPHHLLLTEESCSTYDPNYKMNPPLRRQRDIAAIRKGIRDGVITLLGTDHAPHTREEKELVFSASPSGLVSLDCALGLYAKALIDTGTIDWPDLLRMMTIAPAQLLGLKDKGTLLPGADADVTLIDPACAWTVRVDDFASRGRNCPYDGWTLNARPVATIVTGTMKMNRIKDRVGAWE